MDNQKLTYGSIFAGVGGFDLGFDAAGWQCKWQIEKDPHCQNILQKHWPTTQKYGDINTVDGTKLTPVDVIAFGSPCQDLSQAGKQQGLNGKQSSLFLQATRIIKEMRQTTNGTHPTHVIWENVPGALTSNKGNDFAKVLDTMAETGACDIQWAILDTQHFNLPQRRKRIYLYAQYNPTNTHQPPIFDFTQNSPRDNRTINTQQQQTPPTTTPSTPKHNQTPYTKSRRAQTNKDHETWKQQNTTNTLTVFDVGAGRETTLITQNNLVRKLTPTETERLMGWPDNHTKTGANNKQTSETRRYKMCGNGVAAPIAQKIAEQITKQHTTTQHTQKSLCG
jgi:DNA (cytosine-5)-methyltransferase 1